MLSKSDEIKHDIERLTAQIEREENNLKVRESNLAGLRAFVDRLQVRRASLEVQLEREEAVLVRNRGESKVVKSGGVEWQV